MEKIKSQIEIGLSVENPCKNKKHIGNYLGVCENTKTAPHGEPGNQLDCN